jgi:hypothetical protein
MYIKQRPCADVISRSISEMLNKPMQYALYIYHYSQRWGLKTDNSECERKREPRYSDQAQ